MIFTAVIYLTGCSSQQEIMIKQGYPPAYAKGYENGCSSGNNAAGSILDHYKKDIQSYKQNSNYRQGWNDGYKQCKAKQDSLQKQYRTNIEQQRMIEEQRHNKKIERQGTSNYIDSNGTIH